MLLICLLILLLSNAVTLRQDKSILYNRSLLSILGFTLIISILNYNIVVLNEGISLYGGLLHITVLGQVFHNIIYIISFIIVTFTAFYTRKWLFQESNIIGVESTNIGSRIYSSTYDTVQDSSKSERFKIIEYPLMLLFVIIGATFLINSSDIVTVFLCIELQSYGLYLLAAFYRNSETSTSASLTYFLLGGMSSCFILLGTALLYSNTGSTNLENFYIINNIWYISDYKFISVFNNNYLTYALVIMVVGFLFKISAAPFHFWSPDVYDAIPTVTTTFVAIIAKLSILIFLFEIIHYTANSSDELFNWRYILIFSSLLSLIVGTVLGLNQFRIKRLYAYSTISHLGFILLSLSINSVESIQAFIFYLIQYSFSNLNAFMILICIGSTLYIKKNNRMAYIDKEDSPVQLINQLKGYFYINPVLAISLTITIYSFVGIPPLVGFFGKQMVLSAAMDKGFVFISLVAILTSVISAVYYLNIIKKMFFENLENTVYQAYQDIKHVRLYSAFTISISVITLLILLFLLLQQDFLNITNTLSLHIINI